MRSDYLLIDQWASWLVQLHDTQSRGEKKHSARLFAVFFKLTRPGSSYWPNLS